MSTKYRIRDNQQPHFLTLTIIQWADIFSRSVYKDIFIHSLKLRCILLKKAMKDQGKKAAVMAKFSQCYDAWLASQEGQTSAYDCGGGPL